MIFFFTIFKCDNLTNVLNIIIINLERLLVGHIRIIVFDPKENMTQITTPSTEYFHFILNLLYYATHYFFYIFNTDVFLKYIYFWLHWVFVLHAGFLQLQQAGATLWLWCTGFSRQRLLFAEPGLQVHRLNSCAWAQMLCGTYDLPGPGIEPESLALVGRFSTTEPSGKFSFLLLMVKIHDQHIVFINIYYQNSILLINGMNLTI